MPLKDYFPIIDDRTYDDIVAEARTRIPRYTPEWTDLNESDPGMTMVQMFAWLTEMQLYRMSKVPELNYLKFLELIGIELAPAKPATAQVGFPIKSNFAQPYVIIPSRTRISTDKPDEKGPIIFETDESLVALNARLDSVQSYDGFAYSDVSKENQEVAAGFEPFGQNPKVEAALYLGFDSKFEFPEVTFSISFWLPEEGAANFSVSCGPDSLIDFPPADLSWEYWNGKIWKSLNVLKDDTNRFTRSGLVYIKAPAVGEIQRNTIGKISQPRYWIRARIVSEEYERKPQLLAIRINTVNVTQAETISNELLGGSNGRPDQVFKLSHSPVLSDTLKLELDEGPGFVEWQEVSDFFGSGRDDTHYVLNRSTGEVRFGGMEQHIPVANPNRFNNIIAKEYRVGGGSRGNVAAGSINSPLSSLPGIEISAVGNLFAGVGGTDEETLNQAKARAPRSIKSRERAVTVEDYELLALESANIARAKALPLYHPDFENISVPGVMSVIIVPDIEHEAPVPSEATLKTVCAYLNQRRLITTELYVLKPTYQEVIVKAEVIVMDGADLAQVKLNCEQILNRYFHPLYGGEDSSLSQPGSGWPFGGDIYYSVVYGKLLLAEVKRIKQLRISLDGKEYPLCSDIELGQHLLLFSGLHQIQVAYDYGQ